MRQKALLVLMNLPSSSVEMAIKTGLALNALEKHSSDKRKASSIRLRSVLSLIEQIRCGSPSMSIFSPDIIKARISPDLILASDSKPCCS